MEKTKEKIDFGFTPSPYQQDIFDFVQHGVGNAVIEAYAGSAKTTTCVAAMKLIPSKFKVMFLAFNKSIADELTEKLKGYDNVDVRTSHSLGFAMIRRNVDFEVEVDEYKYRKYLKNNINGLTSITDIEQLTNAQIVTYIDNIYDLFNFSRFNLAQTESEVIDISDRYSIPIMFDEPKVVLKMMEWAYDEDNWKTVDYTDMVWLPVECALSPKGSQKDFIFVDEFQDQSVMSIELFKKCFKKGTRAIFVGDKKQCINLFAGSTEEAFDIVREIPHTQTFKLPICYRCPKNVINLAQRFVSDIEPTEWAEWGEIKENCHIWELKSGDMVLSRSKAPLAQLYTKLLKRNIESHIKGQDIGINLKDRLMDINIESLGRNLNEDGVFVRLYDSLFEERNSLIEKNGMDYRDATLSSYVMNIYDTINVLYTLSEGLSTKTELMEHIDKVFSENGKGIILSTIHKAKGLEADNVYILCHSSMPSSTAKKDWEKKQEENLIYVAYTRAKKRLGFVSEKEIRPIGGSQNADALVDELRYVEQKVCAITGKEPTLDVDSVGMARFNLRDGVTQTKEDIKDDEIVNAFNEGATNGDDDLLTELDELLK